MIADTSRSVREALIVIGSFVVLSMVATWPLVRHLGNALPSDLGDPLLNSWTLGWVADRLRHGLVGLWSAPILFPVQYALGLSENLIGIAMFVAPVIWISGNPILAHNVAFVLSYALAGSSMYLLVRALTGRRDAAAIAGMIFAFAPIRASYHSHLHTLMSGWMPLSLWGLHRYFAARSIRSLAVFVVAFALQAWSNAYFLYFLAIPVVAVVVYELAARLGPAGVDRRLIWQLAAAAATILLLIAAMVVTYATIRRLYGLHRSYGDWRMFSADLRSYVSVIDDVSVWRSWLSGDRAPERQLFPGLIALLLTAVALWRRPRRSVATLYATIGVVALLLSLGPEPRVWTHRLPLPGPFLLLTHVVPGLDGIRAPARLAVLVLLSVSVLAGFGAARLLAAWPRPRPWLVPIVLALVFVEGLAVPLHLVAFDPKGRPSDRPLYAWLAREPPGAVLELPIHDWSIAPTLTYQFATLTHHHPIVNGYSGYGAALQAFLGGSASPLNELERMSDVLAMLRSLGVRSVVVHPRDYDDARVGTLTAAAIRSASSDVVAEQRFEEATAFRLRAADMASPMMQRESAEIDLRPLSVTASDNEDRVRMAIDGDPATRWLTGRPQSGSEWVRIALDRPRDVTRIVLGLHPRSISDYPRELVVESLNDGRTTVLYKGAVLIPLGRSITGSQSSPDIAIDLPSNVTQTLTLRQTGSSRRWWSIHEVRVWGR